MTRTWSLRARLVAIILLPLFAVALLAGVWQARNAAKTAAEVFDRALLTAALAVVNDVASSGGDALSSATSDLLTDTSGGLVFYHVYAPDGVIVAGYATPPVGIPRRPLDEVAQPVAFEAIYLGRQVAGVRLQTRTSVEGFSGIFTTTVWQDIAVRQAFLRGLITRSVVAIFGLFAAVALIVWFGVRLGLRPLTDLETAIEARSGTDLSPIRRAVPQEVSGIVNRLNALFGQVSQVMTAQSEFIANAAHQLRNPIAGVLSLAESVTSAKTPEQARGRAEDLLTAARETADLSQKLLMLERADAVGDTTTFDVIDLHDTLPQWAALPDAADAANITLVVNSTGGPLPVRGDATMLREALRNLIDNACRHGGDQMTRVDVSAQAQGEDILILVTDNGRGIAKQDQTAALTRFAQISASSASGLGLSIADAVARRHDGVLALEDAAPGLRVTLRLPKASDAG